MKRPMGAVIEDQRDEEIEYLNKRLAIEQEYSARLYRRLIELRAQIDGVLNE